MLLGSPFRESQVGSESFKKNQIIMQGEKY